MRVALAPTDMTAPMADPQYEVALPAAAPLLEEVPNRLHLAVHDATRLGWYAAIPLPATGRAEYSLEVALEVPTNLVGPTDPWPALQSYARLDGEDGNHAHEERSPEAFRRAVVVVSSKLARAREGFVRHCTLIRSSAVVEENQWRPLLLWIGAARGEIANARNGLLRTTRRDEERVLAGEFLALQLWTVLTDCTRALLDTRRALQRRDQADTPALEEVEDAIARALADEAAARTDAESAPADPVNLAQLERLVARMRWLKKHFEGVLFLDVESYEIVTRLSGWFSALTAMVAYLWFLLWQLALERHPVAIGSGVAAFALLTAVAYASRERLKEIGRNWLAGRVQRMFAQRVTRYRVPTKDRQRGPTVVSARESFSQSATRRHDPAYPYGTVGNVTVLRFEHRGTIARPAAANGHAARQVQLVYRLDLSGLLPRLHDAVRGFAAVDGRTGRVAIVDVPRNYELPLRASLRCEAGKEESGCTLVLNKNGLVRIDPAGG
jgi:hypothetical protein